jgi:hypothetical protein
MVTISTDQTTVPARQTTRRQSGRASAASPVVSCQEANQARSGTRVRRSRPATTSSTTAGIAVAMRIGQVNAWKSVTHQA